MARIAQSFIITVLIFILSGLASSRADAAARAFLDRNTITMGETVTLNIEIDSMSGAQPDLSPLAANFRLLGTSNSSQLQSINGSQSARQLWAVALEPLAAGIVGIPALSVGSDTTDPLTLTVLPAPQGASSGAGEDVFLEVEALPTDPYVQQQVGYVVRLHVGVNLAEGQLDEPQVDGARIQRLGGDTRFQKDVANRRYEVIERRYALIPERSGRLEVSAPRFRGAAIDGARSGFFGTGRRLQASGDALTLDVRRKPTDAPDPWLPALELSLSDESGELNGEYRVGEPITLSLRLTARGLAADQLPELILPGITDAQVYPDLESSQTGDSGEWLAGERVRRFAVVPNKAGELQIPAITIDWWNTQTDTREKAEIPARRLTILAAAGAPAAPADPASSLVAGDAGGEGASASISTHSGLWPWISLLLGALWLATLAALIQQRHSKPKLARQAVTPAPAEREPRGLKRALDIGDLAEVARQLRWLAPGAGGVSLDALANQVDDPAQAQAMRALEQALYAGDGADTVSRESLLTQLRGAFRRSIQWRRQTSTPSAKDQLPPLYGATRL
ncbi:MAG: BatD family protein [Pseudomarimonas sp.]